MKGFMFTFDAMMAIAMVMALFSGIVLVGLSEPDQGAKQAHLYNSATDATLVDFYTGGSGTDSPDTSKPVVACNEALQYEPSGNITVRVKRCNPKA